MYIREYKNKGIIFIAIFSLIYLMYSMFFPCSARAKNALTLDIKTDRNDFMPGEPVILYVTLKNIGKEKTEVMRFLEPEYGFVKYSIKGPTGKEDFFLPWAHMDHPSPKMQLSTGEEITKEAKIFYGGNGWTFKGEGKYEIVGVYQGNIKSNRLIINIISPSDTSEKDAATLFLENPEVGRFLLFEGGDHLKEATKRLEQVISRFPQTPYAAYANYALGVNLTKDFANFKENRLRKADHSRAIKYLEKAKKSSVSLYNVIHSHMFLIEGYEKMGDIQKAKALRKDLDQITTDRFKTFKPIVDRVIKDIKIQ